MANSFNHDTYISPFTWRYGSPEMRSIWSEKQKRLLLRRTWVALAQAQERANLVTKEQVADLIANCEKVDIERATEIEREIQHDLMAEIKCYAEQCPIGGPIIHLGATSMDVLDNVDILRQQAALDLLLEHLKKLLALFGEKIAAYAELPCMAYTHLQPAEITTVGYRLAQTAQDLQTDWQLLSQLRSSLKGKGLKGAVGSSASYMTLLGGTEAEALALESDVMAQLDLEAFEVATQVYPRKQDYLLASAVASLAQTLYKFAFDVRVLQSPAIGEVSEPFGAKQVGSSAMPFKRNPIISEKVNSLCRLAIAHCQTLWQNAAHSLLERTLDDSANRRVVIPELFLATEEALLGVIRITEGLRIHTKAIEKNLEQWGPFAASERLLMELGRQGANRQEMHEVIRKVSLQAWDAIQHGKKNPLVELLSTEAELLKWLSSTQIQSLLEFDNYVGVAPTKARQISEQLLKDYA